MRAFLRRNKTPLLLSLLYFIPGMLWVLFSDNLLFPQPRSLEAEKLMEIDKIKDASFVAGISVLLVFLMYLSRRKLVDTHLQYQNLFDQHPHPMWIYEISTLKFMAVNNAAVEQYGYSREEFLSMTLTDIRPASEAATLKEYIANGLMRQKTRKIWHHLKKSGELITVDVVADDVTFFKKPCRLVCATDVTEKIQKEEDIRRLSLVAKTATNSIIITGPDAKIEWVNEAFTTLTGYTLPEVTGRRPSDFLHGPSTDQQTRDEIFACIEQQKPYSGEILNYRKDGSVFWLRLTVSPVFADGVVTHFVTVQTDITAIKEQNARLRDIARTVSHGFRKPLANILGLLEFVHETGTEQKIVEDLKASAQELDRQLKVIVEKTTRMH